MVIKKYGEGDIIAFYRNNILNISRINEIQSKDINIKYIIKGDNNYYYDITPIEENDIKGKVSVRLPKVGLLILMAQSNIFTVITSLIVIMTLMRIVKQRQKDLMRKQKANQYKEGNKIS